MRSLNSLRVHERKLGYQQVCCYAVEDDNTLEHLNRAMKVSGGLVGITQNERAPPKFFLTDPELTKLASEAISMAGVYLHTPEQHHNLSASIVAREDKGVQQLTAAIKSFTNPFFGKQGFSFKQ